MDRITQAQLEKLCDRLNRTLGRPETPYTRNEAGKLVANVGNYHISGAYGGVALEEMCNEAGGVNSVFNCGHVPKRELYNRMWAFMAGIDAVQRQTANT